MADLRDLSARLSAVRAMLAPSALTEFDSTIAKAAETEIGKTRKPNFYKWSGATFATRVTDQRVTANGREWAVAERGRQGGRHGTTQALRTWTNATDDAATALETIAARELDDRIRRALG